MRWGGVVAAALLLVTGACRSTPEEPSADIALDGSRRDPDVEGVVNEVSVEEITVDGETYELSRNLLAFNTYSLVALPVLRTEGSYVQLGIESDEVVWLAEVAKVLPEGGGRAAFYRGTLLEVDDEHLVFQDGTVLRAGEDLERPTPPAVVLARIDVDDDRVVELTAP